MANFSTGRGKNENLRDFAHAAKTFTSAPGYTLAPKAGFTFHVRMVYTQSGQAGADINTLSVLVKSADLPKFNIDTEVLNKYNKKEVVQKRIVYEPITITFHDDADNNVRDMWLAYNKRFYTDSNISQQAYTLDDTYSPVRLATRYGLDTGKSGRFLSHVEIYSMANHVYTKYILLNPIIESFDFDTVAYEDGGKVLQTVMRLQYENVLYAEGKTENIPGFGKSSQFYDNEYSRLTPKDLSVPQSSNPLSDFETELENNLKAPPLTNFDLQILPKVTLSDAQQRSIKVNAATSLTANKRFSFPTATEIKNLSEVVDINAAKRVTQGVINRSGAVSSNGSTIGTSATSSIGRFDTSTQVSHSLLIYPKVPTGLSTAEAALFNESYPPLLSTDTRAKEAPYV